MSADEITQLIDIERVIGRIIEREYMDGYEPVHEVPASPVPRAHKPKKHKKTKSKRS